MYDNINKIEKDSLYRMFDDHLFDTLESVVNNL